MIETLMAALLLAGPSTIPADVVPPDLQAADTVQEASPLTLEEVLESALGTHPSLAGARAGFHAATARVNEARASRLPSLAATGVATRFQEPMVVAPIHAFDLQNRPDFDETLLQGHARAEYTLFDGGARGARVRAAQAGAEAAEAGVAVARDGVLAEATAAYLGALTAREVLAAVHQQVQTLEAEVERTRMVFEEGRIARVSVLRAEAALSRARAERAATREALDLALRRLARVSGLEANRVLVSPLVGLQVREVELPDRETLLARARAANPALVGAATRVNAAELGVVAARSTFLPRVALSGQYSLFAATGVDASGEWQAGVQLSYPLFTGGARGAGVERALAEADAARAERRLVDQQVADAVDGALVALQSARARVTALEAAVAQSEEVARIEALALEEGAGVQTDYLRAEADLLQARSTLAEARHRVLEAWTQLARATGQLTLEWLVEMTEEVGS